MEHCPTCNLQYKRMKKYNHDLTKTHIAANCQYHCKRGKKY